MSSLSNEKFTLLKRVFQEKNEYSVYRISNRVLGIVDVSRFIQIIGQISRLRPRAFLPTAPLRGNDSGVNKSVLFVPFRGYISLRSLPAPVNAKVTQAQV
jgi:hypothetical protein